MVKCHPSTIAQGKKCQIASLIKVSILKATDTKAERPAVVANEGIVTAEEQDIRVGTIYGT